ncbi:MAG: phage tail sheath C-terminal domain-containing protein [Cetobacterium sp.]|uniref:phage tail sheath C-terminal domain-containing protein n=1 Tax=Cetobacterium sp. TaxID=2071632 RepID=UPI003F35D2DA
MSTNNGMPQLDIVFKGLGVSAIKRGERGYAVLILEDETEGTPKTKYSTISDFGSEEQAKFTSENVEFIKDALEGVPLALYVFKFGQEDVLTDLFNKIKGIIPRNSWIAVYSNNSLTRAKNQSDLVSFVKGERKNNKKRYKAFAYKVTTADDMGVVNHTTEKVTFADDRGEMDGSAAIPYLLGYYAGLSMMMSGIAKPLKFKSVVEPEDLDEAISNGEHILFNDEGEVRVARAVNSLVTMGQDVIEDMTHINTVEKMDLIYCDLFKAWNDSYKGKYPNILDNQMLLISAINGYFKSLAIDYILDPNFDNRAEVDIEAQRLANYLKYGEEVVEGWDDAYAMKMTVGTKVFLKANNKIPGIMEDFCFNIFV